MSRHGAVDQAVMDGVAALVRKGLPVRPGAASAALLGLASVMARSSDSTSDVALAAALDNTVRAALARFDDNRYAAAGAALFGVAHELAGATLTARRAAAAKACGREVHHFRKRLEPDILHRLAGMLIRDAEQFADASVVAPRISPETPRSAVPTDVFAWELVAREEQASRVWAAVYALRAELLLLDRLMSMEIDSQEIGRHAITAAWRYGLLRAEAEDYRETYRADRLDPFGLLAVDRVVGLAGWTPSISREKATSLAAAARACPDRAGFVGVMREDIALGDYWVSAWCSSSHGDGRMEKNDQGT